MFNLNSKGLSLPTIHGSKRGQGMVEYALILVLIAVIVIIALSIMGPAINGVFVRVICRLDPNADIVIKNAATGETGSCKDLELIP